MQIQALIIVTRCVTGNKVSPAQGLIAFTARMRRLLYAKT